jgi:hypothetical protein
VAVREGIHFRFRVQLSPCLLFPALPKPAPVAESPPHPQSLTMSPFLIACLNVGPPECLNM